MARAEVPVASGQDGYRIPKKSPRWTKWFSPVSSLCTRFLTRFSIREHRWRQLGCALTNRDWSAAPVGQCLLYPRKRTYAVRQPMSAKGQKRTFAMQGMSALLLIATAKADFRTRSCPLYPQKRTSTRLFDHRVGVSKQC
jgi:hypothetical protein